MGCVTGKKLLSTYLARFELSYAAFARLVGADRARIQRCAKGKRSPGLLLALAIERETKGAVPAVAWTRRRPLKRKTH
jgi:DNA-binding transcriptional regulator YdaS (Cro superfamily)